MCKQVILLNGPSSSGKTTLAKKLQDAFETPYLHIGIDKLIGMMPAKLNNWEGAKVDQGFWWHITHDDEGRPLAHIQQGPYAKRISALLLQMVLTMLQAGHNVIVDEVCLEADVYEVWQKALASYSTLFVGVKASTKTLEERELARCNRMHGSARAQNAIVHENKTYDIMLDTDELTMEDCIKRVRGLV